MGYVDLRSQVPMGESGAWTVRKFMVTKTDAVMTSIRLMQHGRGYVPEGAYTGLYRGNTVVMSDTPDEIRDHQEPIWKAKRLGGDILINGLGLGVVLAGILQGEKVESVTVIEKSPDVITLVAPTFADDPRVTIIESDAYLYKPPKGQLYTVVWHDIWDDICSDNLPLMTKLHRKYGRRADWQGSWGKERARRQRGTGY